MGWRWMVKGCVDRISAAIGLIVLSPLMLVIAAAIRATLGSPVLFRQVRPGYRARPFELVKFRTMREANDAQGRPLPDAQRVTRLGRLLRSTSLDELPQLWNVLKGELSLVGPRPLMMRYLDRYSPRQARRHEVMPGITGWCQVNGRNGIDWSRKLELDVWYVENWSLWLDLRILAMTVVRVAQRSGIDPAGPPGSGEFLGSVDPNAQP
jgi:lipopolysaccharide/colanic/teichoic acid biosynthesis glycosyltransferase